MTLPHGSPLRKSGKMLTSLGNCTGGQLLPFPSSIGGFLLIMKLRYVVWRIIRLVEFVFMVAARFLLLFGLMSGMSLAALVAGVL